MRAGRCLVMVCVLLAVFMTISCGNSNSQQATDYSVSSHWMALPIEPVLAFPVDVFYLYPTAWTSSDPDNPHVCAIDEPTMLQQAPVWFAK